MIALKIYSVIIMTFVGISTIAMAAMQDSSTGWIAVAILLPVIVFVFLAKI